MEGGRSRWLKVSLVGDGDGRVDMVGGLVLLVRGAWWDGGVIDGLKKHEGG